MYAKRDAELKTKNEFILPPEILELVYIKGLFNADVAEQALNEYSYDTNSAPKVIEFFLKYFRLDLNHYIVSSYADHLFPKIYYSLEALLKVDADNSTEPDGQSHLVDYQDVFYLRDKIAAMPLFFLAIEHNDKAELDHFKAVKVDFSLNAYYLCSKRVTNHQGITLYESIGLNKERPISAFQYAILKGHLEMLEYFSPGLALTRPESKSFLTFAVKNKVPAASINWLLDRGVPYDPREFEFIDIIQNSCIRLLEAFSRQKNFNVHSLENPNYERT